MVQQCAAVVRREVSSIRGVGIFDQDRSDLSRLLLEFLLSMGAPPVRDGSEQMIYLPCVSSRLPIVFLFDSCDL